MILTSQTSHPLITLYELAWGIADPLLKSHPRISSTHRERSCPELPQSDVWIQAASAGEAFLAVEIARMLDTRSRLRVLITTGTRQGMEILTRELEARQADSRYFPFDRPSLMMRAVRQVQPRCMVLLETEIWPGLLFALKEDRVPVLLINARMSERSRKRYCRFRGILNHIAPRRIIAISAEDARRYADVFPSAQIDCMHNIKFDRVRIPERPPAPPAGLDPARPFIVLGSVRKEEEPAVMDMIKTIIARVPDVIIGLFPRHMERINFWKSALARDDAGFILRSDMHPEKALPPVILWDRFGELGNAYAASVAAFVGGSLAPLGGQNFLEPLMQGIRPVIGPSTFNFEWVGNDLFKNRLVQKAGSPGKAASLLIEQIRTFSESDRQNVKAVFHTFLSNHFGGTQSACNTIASCLEAERHV